MSIHEVSQQDFVSDRSWKKCFRREDTFHQFSKLPIELREKVWSYTLPGPRLIEVGSFSRDAAELSEDEEDRPFFLRIAGPLSVILSIHIEREEIPQQWFSPVALFVCHESRRYTLRHYRLIQHDVLDSGSFYCDPSVDVLWFNYEFTGHDANAFPRSQESMERLCRWYGSQLDIFKNVLEEQMFWNPEGKNQEYLASLPSLETILIMDTSRRDTSIFLQFDDEDRQHCITVGRKEYSSFMRQHPDWPLKSIEYLDRDSTFIDFMWDISLWYRDDTPLHPLG